MGAGSNAHAGMRRVPLPGGATMPVLGLGTWRMGEASARRAAEVGAVRAALSMGYRLIDTAEMYGDGGAEAVVGQAVEAAVAAGEVRRDELFIVSKVYPHNATRKGTPAACDRSRARLGMDRIDLYLLHWRGEVPLRETAEAMRALVAGGRIGAWGVSNFDVADMQELQAVERELGGREAACGCAADQVYYSLSARGPEFALLPWLRKHALPMMAYSPIDQGALAGDPVLRAVGERHGASAAQVALAWVLRRPGVVAIPKAAREAHLRENLAAVSLKLASEEVARIERRFPPPRRRSALAVI